MSIQQLLGRPESDRARAGQCGESASSIRFAELPQQCKKLSLFGARQFGARQLVDAKLTTSAAVVADAVPRRPVAINASPATDNSPTQLPKLNVDGSSPFVRSTYSRAPSDVSGCVRSECTVQRQTLPPFRLIRAGHLSGKPCI